jgi:4'-phosphopantetheinyl transferase
VNQAPEAIRFQYGPQGKPELANAGSTVEQSLQFNLSHSQELGLCAITRGRRLGVDLEHVRAAALDGLEIAERFFTATETALVRSAPAETRAATFLRLWTRKEAYLKGHGKGLSMPLNEFEVSLEMAQVRFPLQGDVFDPGWSVHEVHPGEGYVGALAVEGGEVAIVQKSLEPG